ncbi:MAG: hypothetical protein ACLFV5_09385 [Anaerolineales bacterium]
MMPVTNAYEMEYLIRDHMREGLCEMERDRLVRTAMRQKRHRGSRVISSVSGLLVFLSVFLKH